MFVAPEVLWGALLNAISSIFNSPVHSFYNQVQVFNDYPIIAYLILLIELIGVSGFFRINLEYNKKSTKYLFSGIMIVIVLSLIGLIFLNYSINKISFS